MVFWSRTEKEELDDRGEVFPCHSSANRDAVPWPALCRQYTPRRVTITASKVTCPKCLKEMDSCVLQVFSSGRFR